MTKLFFPYKLCLYSISLLFGMAGYCQKQEVGAKEILSKINISPASYPFLIIALPTSDCYKCRMPLSQMLGDLSKKKMSIDSTKSILLTDNYVFAKEFLDDNEMPLPIKVLKKINQEGQLCEDGRSAIYILVNTELGYKYGLATLTSTDIDSMVNQFSTVASIEQKTTNKNSSITQDTSSPKHFLIRDSVFSKGSFQVINVGNNIAFFDEKLQKVASLKNRSSFIYQKPTFKKYEKMRLLNVDIDSSHYRLLTAEETAKWSRITKLPLIHINDVLATNDSIFCFFTANRYYDNLSDVSAIKVIPHNFLAIKAIKNINQFSSMADLSSYENYVPLNLLFYGGYNYMLSSGTLSVTGKEGLWFRVINYDTSELTAPLYAGLANIKLIDLKPVIVQMDSLLENGERFMIFENGNQKNVCTLFTDSLYKDPIKEVQGHYYLNTNNGFSYLYNAYKKSNNVYAVIYLKDKDGVHVADIDIQHKKIIADKKLPITEPVDEIILNNNSYIIIGKKMINEDYNIGEIFIKRIPIL